MKDPDLYDLLRHYLANQERLAEIAGERQALEAEARRLRDKQNDIAWAFRRGAGDQPVIVDADYSERYVFSIDPESTGLLVEKAIRAIDLMGKRPEFPQPAVAEAVADSPIPELVEALA